MSFGHETFMIIGDDNQNEQGGKKLKAVDYCLQYGIRHLRKNITVYVSFRISASGTLTIFEPRGKSDSALYTCIANNGRTETSVFYKISVQGKMILLLQ